MQLLTFLVKIVWTGSLKDRLSSNKPPHYLLSYSDFKGPSTIYKVERKVLGLLRQFEALDYGLEFRVLFL